MFVSNRREYMTWGRSPCVLLTRLYIHSFIHVVVLTTVWDGHIPGIYRNTWMSCTRSSLKNTTKLCATCDGGLLLYRNFYKNLIFLNKYFTILLCVRTFIPMFDLTFVVAIWSGTTHTFNIGTIRYTQWLSSSTEFQNAILVGSGFSTGWTKKSMEDWHPRGTSSGHYTSLVSIHTQGIHLATGTCSLEIWTTAVSHSWTWRPIDQTFGTPLRDSCRE